MVLTSGAIAYPAKDDSACIFTSDLPSETYVNLTHGTELALARLPGVSGLVPSVGWILYSVSRKEALLASKIKGTQATVTDLIDEEAGFTVSNTDDVQEVTNYRRAFRLV